MLKKVSIRNFRGIQECELDELGTINLFIGPNNSGKSSILEALYVSSLVVNHNNYEEVNPLQYLLNRRVIRGTLDKSRLWYNYDMKKDIQIDLTFTKGMKANVIVDRDLRITTLFDFGFPAIISEMENLQYFLNPGDLDEHRRVIYSFENNKYSKTNGEYFQFPTLSKETMSYLNPKFLEYVDEYIRYFQNCFIIDNLIMRNYEKFEKKYLNKLLIDRKDKELIEFINKTFESNIDNLSYLALQNEFILVFLTKDSLRKIDDMGDGFRFIFMTLALIHSLDNEMFLIEELENHQHPMTFDKIANAFVKFSKERKKQLFLTTHSIELIKAFLSNSSDINLKIYHMSNPSGKVNIKNIGKEDAERLNELGIDLRSLNKFG